MILIEDGLPVVVGEAVNGDDDMVDVNFLFFSTSLFLFPLLSVLNPLSESLSSCSVVASYELCLLCLVELIPQFDDYGALLIHELCD